jgi:hypothetical protein
LIDIFTHTYTYPCLFQAPTTKPSGNSKTNNNNNGKNHMKMAQSPTMDTANAEEITTEGTTTESAVEGA